jgi:hypothetical protein
MTYDCINFHTLSNSKEIHLSQYKLRTQSLSMHAYRNRI